MFDFHLIAESVVPKEFDETVHHYENLPMSIQGMFWQKLKGKVRASCSQHCQNWQTDTMNCIGHLLACALGNTEYMLNEN
jgi:hypothetical protein